VIQDCRGAHGSEGVLIPYHNEGQDGYDTLEWIVDQPWCNGRVGTWGSSYVGPVAATLDAGHRLQVDICGAYFPLFDRNTNTGQGPFSDQMQKSTEQVHHGPNQPSQIVLPIIK